MGVVSSMLMITCPITLQDVPTGIITDESSLQQLKSESVEFSCPAYGQRHHWSSSQTWLKSSGVQSHSLKPQKQARSSCLDLHKADRGSLSTALQLLIFTN